MDPAGRPRFTLHLSGEAHPAWGEFQRLILLDQDMPTTDLRSNLGWRELAGTPEETLTERPSEEGGGLQPPFGFPIFGPDFFIGAEHPVACLETSGNHARVFHHPLWREGELHSVPLIFGVCDAGESAAAAFARYFASIRRPAPARAIVEINTFWTDPYDGSVGDTTDLASYRAMFECWSQEVLGGEKDLVSHFLLDAGWQDPASLYRPQASNGGPGDQALAELGRDLEANEFAMRFWFSLNGPIGIDRDWTTKNGFRIFNRGTGAGYSSNQGRTRYLCLADPRWEEDRSRRFEELISHVPVTFFKGAKN